MHINTGRIRYMNMCSTHYPDLDPYSNSIPKPNADPDTNPNPDPDPYPNPNQRPTRCSAHAMKSWNVLRLVRYLPCSSYLQRCVE